MSNQLLTMSPGFDTMFIEKGATDNGYALQLIKYDYL